MARGMSVWIVGAALAAALSATLAGCGGEETIYSRPAPSVTTATVTATPSTSPTGASSANPTTSTTDDRPPTTYDEALARIQAGRDIGSLEAFTTPDGNIFCTLLSADQPVACELASGTVENPEVCTDPQISRAVGRIELEQGRAVAVCNTDTIRGAAAPVLDYDEVVTTRDTQCVSEVSGVTCVARNMLGGFFLRAGEYVLIDNS